MGRNRRPVESRLLDGTYQRSRHGPLPDASEDAAPPKCPAELKGAARKFWHEFSALLVGIVRERDGLMLAELCRWRAELERARKALAGMIPGDKGYNQLLVGCGICADKMDKIGSRFGLTPSDRAKLRAESVVTQKARVPVKPRTKLDKKGAPK